MTKLASALASRKLSKTEKAFIILASLGGKSSTGEVKATGVAHGARDIASWNVSGIFSRSRERVALLADGWMLLEAGYAVVANTGFEIEVASPHPAGSPKKSKPTFMIGHGRSRVWRDLKEYLRDNYDCEIVEFNSQSVVGISNKERLQELLDQADVAFLVATAEDEQGDGRFQARQNVVHEIGLFQGKLGFERAVVMLEEGCDEFSNISGIGQIRFPKDDIDHSADLIRKHLRDRLGIPIK